MASSGTHKALSTALYTIDETKGDPVDSGRRVLAAARSSDHTLRAEEATTAERKTQPTVNTPRSKNDHQPPFTSYLLKLQRFHKRFDGTMRRNICRAPNWYNRKKRSSSGPDAGCLFWCDGWTVTAKLRRASQIRTSKQNLLRKLMAPMCRKSRVDQN